ncbi:hypothetical protein [Vibrio parahaemolyticus]|uniref:hypothetical protein n=1 Tax=Vibrio parahaemolyticus TaxID=670 RepID=UPI0038923CC1
MKLRKVGVAVCWSVVFPVLALAAQTPPEATGSAMFYWRGDIPPLSAEPQYWIVTPTGELLQNTNTQGGVMILTNDTENGVNLASAASHAFKVVTIDDYFGEYDPALAKDVDYKISLRFLKTGINGMFDFGGRNYFMISANGEELDSRYRYYPKGDYAVISVGKMNGAEFIPEVDVLDSVQIHASVAVEVKDI